MVNNNMKKDSLLHLAMTDDDDDGSNSSYSDQSTSTIGVSTVMGHNDEDGAEEPKSSTKQIASRETQQVWASKLLVGLVLAASATGAGIFTYRYMTSQEQNEFERKFEGYAQELIAVSETKAVGAFGSLATFGKEITSLARYGGMEWPFVTVDSFHIRGADYHNLTGALATFLCPIIPEADQLAWGDYSETHKDWIEAYYNYTNTTGPTEFPPMIFTFDNGTVVPTTTYHTGGPVTTLWQSFPATPSLTNYHLESTPLFARPQEEAKEARRGVLTERSGADISWFDTPTSIVLEPIFRSFEEDADIVAYLDVYLPWDTYFENVLSSDSPPVRCVVTNPCGGNFTLEIVGPEVVFLGYEDLHDPNMEEWGISSLFAKKSDLYLNDTEHGKPQCQHSIHIYPSSEMKSDHETYLPIIMTIGAVAVFLFTSLVFVFYDYLQQRQNHKVANSVQRSTEIVSHLFPSQIHDRLFGNNEDGEFLQKTTVKSPLLSSSRRQSHAVEDYFEDEENGTDGPEMYTTPPVADLFHNCTVMEADIVGFTAWSSVREPVQVFRLLEALYGAFDEIALRRRVFKVETVGDAYVAVAGLPTPRRDHAAAMCRFARDCLAKMNCLTSDLEVALGPGTSQLSMRFGLHSGSVVAGVLRGDGLRFQLFGETVDIAEEMERTSEINRIHISEDTAKELQDAGKGHWLQKRSDKIMVKGKGELQSYWVVPNNSSSGDASSTGESSADTPVKDLLSSTSNMGNRAFSEAEGSEEFTLDQKDQRLVDWNVSILTKHLKLVMARRKAIGRPKSFEPVSESALLAAKGETVLDEVKEIVCLPKYRATGKEVDPETIELSMAVKEQLHSFVSTIAMRYNANPFHSLEHASHVTMSVNKLLSRITAPQTVSGESNLHDYTFGITSDPLTQFAVILSALIHDLDHSGVPNATLVTEDSELAAKYKNKSVAEQNSVDLAWALLMKDRYKDLRKCIYTTQEELERFRSMVINMVLATDIADRDLGALRKARWNKAFKLGDSANHADENPSDQVNRKATVVLEHLIQASDIAHTMQHWHVYRKWNERLFQEMQKAYMEGRSESNPAEKWYEGELGFFDFYIIPLAKKLKDCGVFGVSSAEYLNYALANRDEWMRKGRGVVDGYVREYVNVRTEGEVDVKKNGSIRNETEVDV